MQFSASAAASVALAWVPSTDPSVVGYNLYYGGASGVYTNKINAGSSTNAVVSGLTAGDTYYFAATAYDSSGVESPFSNQATYAVPANGTNSTATLNAIRNLSINENSGLQTVKLSGIHSGNTNGTQLLTVTAKSHNPDLISDLLVNYNGTDTTGILTFTPAPNAYGTALVTVTISDAQTQGILFAQTFTVTVKPKNHVPSLNSIHSVTLLENAGMQTVNLSGIGSGFPNELLPLTVTVASSNPALIPAPTVNYTNGETTGNLTFTPVPDAFGKATITVTVNNGQPFDNLRTRTFTVTVQPVPTLDPIADLTLTENAAMQTVNLTGISSGAPDEQLTLKITATSGNTKLLPNPTITYTNPSPTGTLTFQPVTNALGITTITVTVNDGGKGNTLTSRTFTVGVLAPVGNALSAATKPAAHAAPDVTPPPPIAAVLTPTAHAAGQFALTVSGSTNQTYIVQASTNLVDWVPVWTNTAPFTYTDVNAGLFSRRYYRSVSVP